MISKTCNNGSYNQSFGLNYSKNFCKFLKSMSSDLNESEKSFKTTMKAFDSFKNLKERNDGLTIDIKNYTPFKTVFDNMQNITVTNGKNTDTTLFERIAEFVIKPFTGQFENYKNIIKSKAEFKNPKILFYRNRETLASSTLLDASEYFKTDEFVTKSNEILAGKSIAKKNENFISRFIKKAKLIKDYEFDYIDWYLRLSEEKLKGMNIIKKAVDKNLA